MIYREVMKNLYFILREQFEYPDACSQAYLGHTLQQVTESLGQPKSRQPLESTAFPNPSPAIVSQSVMARISDQPFRQSAR